MNQDEDQLRLLSIFHYIVGGLSGLFALFPILHLVVGIMLLFAPEQFGGPEGQAPPPLFGWMFFIFAGVMITVGLVFATLVLTTGRFIAKRTHHLFCLVIAGVECLFVPFGTVLGVFTIVVLTRDSVKQLFFRREDSAEVQSTI